MNGADGDLFKWAIQIGGPMAALLLVCGYFYRKDMKYYADQYREDMKYYTDQMKSMHENLTKVLIDNTAAFSVCSEVVKSLHVHMTEGDRRVDSERRLEMRSQASQRE